MTFLSQNVKFSGLLRGKSAFVFEQRSQSLQPPFSPLYVLVTQCCQYFPPKEEDKGIMRSGVAFDLSTLHQPLCVPTERFSGSGSRLLLTRYPLALATITCAGQHF